MLEVLILVMAAVVAFVVAAVEAWQLAPSSLSESELQRRAAGGDTHAGHELRRRAITPLFFGLQRVVVSLLVVVMVGILAARLPLWLALLVSLALLLVVGVVTAHGALVRLVSSVQRKLEPKVWKLTERLSGVLKFFAPHRIAEQPAIASKDELHQLISQDRSVLSDTDRKLLLGAMAFPETSVTEAMVPRQKITSIDDTETVGPLLLDRLHKAGHNVFPVIHKNLDQIIGLLYMSDLVPLDPDLKDIKEAVRPRVHYLSHKARLADVLAASLQSGRQLFIVVDDNANTLGLITLRDALVKLLGSAPPAQSLVSIDPKKAK